MFLRIFCIYDAVAKTHGTPFFLPETAQAQREFKNCANNPEHAFCRNPSDYTLYELGQFDIESGMIDIYEKLEHLSTAASYKDTPE